MSEHHMRYNFKWDPRKAARNFRKHAVGFERATSIFRDPRILSVPDIEHSESEERWITIGLDESGILLVISHTFTNISISDCEIRIISARKAIRSEANQYEEGI